MTPQAISERLIKLAEDMEALGAAMDYYGGFADWAARGRDLVTASAHVRQWSQDMVRDVPLTDRPD